MATFTRHPTRHPPHPYNPSSRHPTHYPTRYPTHSYNPSSRHPTRHPPHPYDLESKPHHLPSPALSHSRHGFHPLRATIIALKSGCFLGALTNLLWPFVPIGITLHFVRHQWHLWIFITNYLSMLPAANLLSFSSAGLSHRVPRVAGIVLQTTVASSVEIILCILLLFKDQFRVIQAAILGSMLANLLLCTGLCFVVGGLRTKAQEFGEALVEAGGGLLLVSVAALMLPAAFYEGAGRVVTEKEVKESVLSISRYTAVLLLVAYAMYLFFQLRTHHLLFDRALWNADRRNKDRDDNIARAKLTTVESAVFVAVALTLVCLHSVFMVEQIHWIVVNRHVSDAFMGLILVPLVEKAAEHLSAIDEAWDDAMDFALSHLLGSTVQTALLVAPVVVVVGWIAGRPLDLHFEVFMVVVLVFAVLVVGNFIKDRKSNYLEGVLCVIFYVIIAIATWYYPNPEGFEEEH